jgi:multidrug resistance protein, MATE family
LALRYYRQAEGRIATYCMTKDPMTSQDTTTTESLTRTTRRLDLQQPDSDDGCRRRSIDGGDDDVDQDDNMDIESKDCCCRPCNLFHSPRRRDDQSSPVPLRSATTSREARALLVDLALPIIVVQLALAFPAFAAASFVGRNLGHLDLAGFTLANLTTNLFGMSLLQGMYTASDTIGPALYAVSATRKELGVLAVRGFVLSLLVTLPVALLLSVTLRSLLATWGEDPGVSDRAVLWYRITALALPFYAAVMVAYKFLSAQNRLGPMVITLGLSCALILPLYLRIVSLLSGGYAGTAWALTAFQVTQAGLLLSYLWIQKPYDPATWISWKHAWRCAVKDRKAVVRYLQLGMGGVLASTSWVYWETICILVGSHMGPLALSAHCVACQVLCLLYMLPQGVGVAMAVRLSSVVAMASSSTTTTTTLHATKPKVLVMACLAASTLVFAVVSVLLYAARDIVLGLFTTEDAVVVEAQNIWGKVCWYNFNTSMFGIHFGIATALGMQRVMGLVTVVALWACAFPVMYWRSFASQSSLGTVWECLWPPYLAINLIMSLVLLARDWENENGTLEIYSSSSSLDELRTNLLDDYSDRAPDDEANCQDGSLRDPL